MKGPLFLTQYKSKEQVYVQDKIVETLTQYQIDGIRFLYQQCILKNQNVILNNDPGMNEERQICAFLSAVERPTPSVIVCQYHCLSKWYYEFFQANLIIVTAEELIKNDSWESDDLPDAVILTHDQLKHLKSVPIEDWHFFIIQNLECLQKSRYIKNVNSQLRIGMLDQSYLDLSPELQWFAMNWANTNLVEEKEKFIESVTFKKTNFLWPFPDYWRRIIWETIDKFKPTEEEFVKYSETIKTWCRENKPSLLQIYPSAKTNSKTTRKRSCSKQKKKTNTASKKRRVIPKEDISTDSENENVISSNRISRAIQSSSSDSETQDFDVADHQVAVESSSGKIFIQNEVTSSTTITVQSMNSLDDSKNSCILDTLLNTSDSSTSSQIKEIKDEPKSLEPEIFELKTETKSESNFILDSLIDSPEPSTSKSEFRISDDENESCPILDLLF